MQLINGTQFLNITFLLVLFASASAAAAFGSYNSHSDAYIYASL